MGGFFFFFSLFFFLLHLLRSIPYSSSFSFIFLLSSFTHLTILEPLLNPNLRNKSYAYCPAKPMAARENSKRAHGRTRPCQTNSWLCAAKPSKYFSVNNQKPPKILSPYTRFWLRLGILFAQLCSLKSGESNGGLDWQECWLAWRQGMGGGAPDLEDLHNVAVANQGWRRLCFG